MKPLSEELPAQKQTKSLIQEASQQQLKVPQAEPLPDIVNRESIDVKEKVGWHDYLRTPDRVLKKIGLEKESNLLRQKYDDYLKQLPKEIDKVTAWSKQVPAESNQRIFKFLDGQPVQLNKQELKVAGEIKTYLKDWADKLGLPEEKRITNYITHIFEKDFIKKEFDPEFAKLIQNRVAGSVYDPFVEQRLGKMGYVEDTWRALDAYVKRAARKVNMDVALKEIKESAKNLETSQYNYVKKYIDRINLRPTEIDNLVDNTIKQVTGYRFGQRPTAVLTRAGRQAVYRGTLGLNPGTALKNLTQGANTYARLGERYTIKGYWDIFTKGTKELEEVGVLRNNFIEDRTLSAGKQTLQKIDKGLFVFFDTAEKINRGAAYYGAKAQALAKGMSEHEAIQHGLKTVRDTQFTFGAIDTPVAMQSDIVKLLTQFQTYSLKQTEFLGEMVAAKDIAGLVRYGIASMGMVYTVGQLIGMEPKDIIPSFRIGLPPTLKTPVEIGKALVGAPDEYGNKPSPSERIQKVGESLIPYIPAGVQAKKTIQGLKDVGKGYSETKSGLVKYPVEQSVGNYVRGGLFGKYNLPEAQEYYKSGAKQLGEKHSEIFKASDTRQSSYEQMRYNQNLAKELGVSLPSIKNPTQEELDQQTAKLEVRKTKELKKTQDKVYYWNDAEEEVSSILLRPEEKIKELKLSGLEELDKKRTSEYKSSITTAIGKIEDLNALGVISDQEAEDRIKKLRVVKTGGKGRKAPKPSLKVKFPKIPAPVKVKKIKVKRPKKNVKSLRGRNIKIKVPKINLRAKV